MMIDGVMFFLIFLYGLWLGIIGTYCISDLIRIYRTKHAPCPFCKKDSMIWAIGYVKCLDCDFEISKYNIRCPK